MELLRVRPLRHQRRPGARPARLARSFWAVLSLLALALAYSFRTGDAIGSDAPDDAQAGAESTPAPQSLQLRWQRDVGRSVSFAPTAWERFLLICSTDPRLTCLDLETGQKEWDRGFKQPIEAPPALSAWPEPAGRIFVALGGRRPQVRALSPEKGKTVWERETPTPVVQLAAAGDRLWTLEKRGRLSCRSAENGKELWRLSVDSWGPPGFLLEGGRIYYLARADSLLALDSASGGRVWSAGLPGRFAAPPVRAGADLVVLSTDGVLRAVDPGTGSVRVVGRRQRPQTLSPIAVGSCCLTVSAGGVLEMGPTVAEAVGSDAAEESPAAGRARGGAREAGAGADCPSWRFEVAKAVAAPPITVGSTLLLGGVDGTLRVLRLDRGSLVWTLRARHGLRVSPCYAGGLLILATDRGDVISYSYSP